MPSTNVFGDYHNLYTSHSGAQVLGQDAEPDKFNFLSFLATAQAFQIQFLPLTWDHKSFSSGGTAKVHQALMDITTPAFQKADGRERNSAFVIAASWECSNNPSVAQSNGLYYWLGCIDFGSMYIYTSTSPSGPWRLGGRINMCYYDTGMLIDDNDIIYVAYGNSQISVARLSADGFSQVSM
ncbi:hypothetical protein S7711_09840 [Stachybotrys chartarum IBT 7711]|uniref:Glycoside hydrolase family 43 protein n=1 Tax=Stachybotrys chartarum (strain CBS 109288 / IBT 7711) TaxID=1280523 RepID=A0A084B1E5_STACB|nr:hypothetical protein S7711_09840 [Stachybotrys chartarum IBT 7711]